MDFGGHQSYARNLKMGGGEGWEAAPKILWKVPPYDT